MLMILIMGISGLWAQNTNMDEVTIELNEALEDARQELDDAMKDLDNAEGDNDITFTLNKKNDNTPKLGVYLSDLDFEDIYEMHYNYNYGVYVSGVTGNGPADKGGILKGDIIMSFDGQEVKFERHLVSLISSKNIGDAVNVKFFRMGKIYETTIEMDTLKKPQTDVVMTKTGKPRKKLPVGDGSGGWLPIWYMPDMEKFNDMLSDMGFGNETFSEDGFLMNGGGGMGNVGKGWFLGGMGAGYSRSETSKHEWAHYKNGIMDTVMVSRKAKYSFGYGGVTLDKRFAISRKFVSGLGCMIGWGSNEFTISQNDNNGEISNFDFENNPSAQFDGSYDYKSKLKLTSNYILFQPRFTFIWRVLDWLQMRTEVGYMLSYSGNGWKADWNGESVKLLNAPDTKVDGLTFSIGPWFGF